MILRLLLRWFGKRCEVCGDRHFASFRVKGAKVFACEKARGMRITVQVSAKDPDSWLAELAARARRS